MRKSLEKILRILNLNTKSERTKKVCFLTEEKEIELAFANITTACRGHPTARTRGRAPLKRSVTALHDKTRLHEWQFPYWR
jgi:hypothetical protein